MSTTAPTIPPYVFANQGTFPAPVEVDIPATLEVRPDTATATFDGTGAAGDFLACLTFYAPDGSRLCRMFNPQVLHTGDVAEVTYIPPFGSAASSAAATAAASYCWATGDHTQNVGVGAQDVPFITISTNDPATFAIDFAGGLQINQAGTYLAQLGMEARSSAAHPVPAFHSLFCIGEYRIPVAWGQAAFVGTNSLVYGGGTSGTTANWTPTQAVVLTVPPAGVGQSLVMTFADNAGAILKLPLSDTLVTKLSTRFV